MENCQVPSNENFTTVKIGIRHAFIFNVSKLCYVKYLVLEYYILDSCIYINACIYVSIYVYIVYDLCIHVCMFVCVY